MRSLNVIYSRIDFQELPLDEFAEWLGRQTQVNVIVRWPRLAAAGVERDTPITLHRKEALLSAVLRDVLAEAGGEHVALGYRAAGNVITISTRADLDRLLLTRTYEIEDLMIRASDFEALGDIMAHPDVPRRRLMRSAADDRKVPQQELIDVITATLYPDTWKVNGGSGTLRVFRGQLIVRNTPEVHEALAGGLRPVGQAVSTED